MNSSKASSDFGLYRDVNKKSNKNACVKLVVVISVVLVCLVVVYIATSFSRTAAVPVGNATAVAEKLISAPSLRIDDYQTYPSRPFGVRMMGSSPHHFTPTSSPLPTKSTIQQGTAINYPQLTQYRNHHYPKSIQEVIGYMTKNRSFNENKYEREHREKENQVASNLAGLQQTMNLTGGFVKPDPFYPFKPSDPSEINLMATASFRFSPPVWRNFQKMYQPTQQPTQLQQHMTPPNVHQSEDSNIQETVRNYAKPVMVTLNIYPMENGYSPPPYSSRYAQKNIAHRVFGKFPHQIQGDPRARIFGNKVTIHLNVFPEALMPLFNRDKENYTEYPDTERYAESAAKGSYEASPDRDNRKEGGAETGVNKIKFV